jgi:large subunit ribosomal protein L4
MKYQMLNQEGGEIGKVDLNDKVFGAEVREDLVHELITAQLAAKRAASAHVKSRSQVAGGGAKPYRQKGTGHARQGTIRAGHYRGGGVIFGPTNARNYKKNIPRKVRRRALISCFSEMVNRKDLKVLDKIDSSEYKTKNVVRMLGDLELTGKKVLFLIDEKNDYFTRSARNIPGVKSVYAGSVNVYDLVYHDNLVMTKGAADYLGEVYGK